MRQGPFCCEKAENKNKRTHTVVSTAIAVTITHASPPRLSQQQEKKTTEAQTCTGVQLHTGVLHVFVLSGLTLDFLHSTGHHSSSLLDSQFCFPSGNLEMQTYCQWAPWLWDESWEAWTTVSSCIKHMTVTQHGWGPLRHAARGSWLVWRSTYFPCPGGCLKPSSLYSNTQHWSLIEGPSLLP